MSMILLSSKKEIMIKKVKWIKGIIFSYKICNKDIMYSTGNVVNSIIIIVQSLLRYIHFESLHCIPEIHNI